jgi:hypothetical protein
MATAAGITLHVDPSEIAHRYHPADGDRSGYATIILGRPGYAAYANLFFEDTAAIDTVIAELVALKQEIDPPVPGYRLACGCGYDGGCTCPGCQAGKRHQPGDLWHCDVHGNTRIAAPVITDSERTCDRGGLVVGHPAEVMWAAS